MNHKVFHYKSVQEYDDVASYNDEYFREFLYHEAVGLLLSIESFQSDSQRQA